MQLRLMHAGMMDGGCSTMFLSCLATASAVDGDGDGDERERSNSTDALGMFSVIPSESNVTPSQMAESLKQVTRPGRIGVSSHEGETEKNFSKSEKNIYVGLRGKSY
jgi:hypothetical protein